MSLRLRFPARAWILAPVCALAFTLWADYARMQRVELVSKIAREDARVDAGSPTGYADGKRWLIVPEHDNPTYQWIEETELMLARGDWRVRRVDYENAPFGRDVHSASPYRWWLVLVAWAGHALSGEPLALCVERAALYADPLLHIAALVLATILVARRFGPFSAALCSLGLAAFFPLAGAFLPGVANDFGLEQVCALFGTLMLLAGTAAGPKASRWYFAAGVTSGVGLWISASGQVPIIAGIAGGGLLAALVAPAGARGPEAGTAGIAPWRAWAFGGALTSLLAYLVEYFPHHMGQELSVNHPLYGLAWLGLGELLTRLCWLIGRQRPFGGLRGLGAWIASAAAVASLPVAMSLGKAGGFLGDELLSSRLTNLPDGVVARGVSEWISRGGASGALAASILPLLILLPAAWLLLRGRAAAAQRAAIAIALGPVLVALAIAVGRLRWFNTLDVALIALLAAAAPASAAAGRMRLLWPALLCAPLAFGVAQLLPPWGGSREVRLTQAETEGLNERMLAHWLADRAGPDGATVLVPPYRTSSFCFYGGLRGLGTQNWENKDGLSAAFHIVTATQSDEARAVIAQRGVTYIVLPSWDADLDEYARRKLKNQADSFIYALRRTQGEIFGWLRPLPYELQPIAGLQGQPVLVFEVTDEADRATAQSRFVEYLIETRQLDRAAVAGRALLRYPADLGSLVALAQLAKALGDGEAFARAFGSVVSSLSRGSDRDLAWDRRVSLAVVLALGGRDDLSRAQLRGCIVDADASRIRFLTTESLYFFLVLGNRYGVEIPDPELRALALKLLPQKLRERF